MPNEDPNLKFATNADGGVLLDVQAGQMTTLNPTGAFVWEALACGETVESIAASLARETGLQVEDLGRDIDEFINSLKEHKLLS